MNWVDIINTALATTGIVGITLVILGWIAKSLFGQVLVKDLENHKSELASETIMFKASLEKIAYEHNVRFKSLHTKRAKVIADLYEKLVIAEELVTTMVDITKMPELSKDERFKRAHKTTTMFIAHYRLNKIYFDINICNKIESFISKLDIVLSDFRLMVEATDEELTEDLYFVWVASWETIKKEIPPIKEEIEHQFRSLLGIESNTN